MKQIFPLKRSIVFPVNNGTGGQMVFLANEFGLEYHGYTPNPTTKSLSLQISVTHVESGNRAYLVKSFLITEDGFEGKLLNATEIAEASALKEAKKVELEAKREELDAKRIEVEGARHALALAEVEQSKDVEALREAFIKISTELNTVQDESMKLNQEFMNLTVPVANYERINKYADVIKWFTPEGIILDESLPSVGEIELLGVKVSDLISLTTKRVRK